MCKDNDFDIILLTETKIDHTIGDDEISIEGYQCFTKNRTRRGGGVLIYTKNEIRVDLLSDLNVNGMEMLWLKINTDKPFLIGVCYRPPNQTRDDKHIFLDNLYATFDSIVDRYKQYPLFLMGDFNDACTSWPSSHSESELGDELVQLVDSFNFCQLINEPTRGKNILDLIITSNPEYVSSCGVFDPIHDLDHCPIYARLTFKVKNIPNFKRVIRKYTQDNLEMLNINLSNVPWQNLFNNDQRIEETVDIYNKIISDEINLTIPSKEVTIKIADKPGMTTEVRRLFHKCHRLHKIARKC